MSHRQPLTQKDSQRRPESFLPQGWAQSTAPGTWPLPPSPTGTLTGTHIETKVFLNLIIGLIFLDLILKGVLSPSSASDPSHLLLPVFCSHPSSPGPDRPPPRLRPMHNDEVRGAEGERGGPWLSVRHARLLGDPRLLCVSVSSAVIWT